MSPRSGFTTKFTHSDLRGLCFLHKAVWKWQTPSAWKAHWREVLQCQTYESRRDYIFAILPIKIDDRRYVDQAAVQNLISNSSDRDASVNFITC